MRKFVIYLLLLFFASSNAVEAPNATIPGPYSVSTGEYHLAPQIYDDVLEGRQTELWANIHYPRDMANSANKLPLIVLLHGNHPTCGFGKNPHIDSSCNYTETGQCPPGFNVVQNHKGYDYLAQHLASWGFAVVSINANRGITCGDGVRGDFGLNLARGKLILKHLSQLYQWNQQADKPSELDLSDDDTNIIHQFDFANVGLFGHSRGGEGVRAAYNLYLDEDSPWPEKIPDLDIKAIFEIGAVDGQTNRILDANNIAWNQLIPLCDGDVSDFQGRYPFDRMILNGHESVTAQKSLYQVWGANHNYFNSEWQTTDNRDCHNNIRIFDPKEHKSEKQQLIAKNAVLAFFKSFLGDKDDNLYNKNFNPLTSIPEEIAKITQIDRDFTPTPAESDYISVDEFDKPTGINHSGLNNESNLIQVEHKFLDNDWPMPKYDEHPQRVALIKWKNPGDQTYFKAVFSELGEGITIEDYATLDIRMARKDSKLNITSTTDFSVQLQDGAGQVSNAVAIKNYVKLNGPTQVIPLLHTSRIPLSEFQGVDKQHIHAVKFTFNKSVTGAINLANIRIHKQIGIGGNQLLYLPKNKTASQSMNDEKPIAQVIPAQFNQIKLLKPTKKLNKGIEEQPLEIRLTSQIPFDVLDSLPVLRIGNQTFKLSRYPNKNNLKEIAFVLTKREYKQLNKQVAPVLKYGKQWQFKPLR